MGTHEKRRVAVDLDELAGAFENGFPDLSYYLDVESGEVAMVSDDTRRELEEIYQELDNGEDLDDALVSEAIRQRDVPDWVRDALEEADRVERGFGTRYVRVGRARLRRDGRFTVGAPPLQGASIAVYRATARLPHRGKTYSLPQTIARG